MFTFIIIIALVICVILGFFILIQNPKGGGIGGSFGGAANQLFGYSKSSDGIEKFTWYLVIAVFVLCLTSAAFKPSQTEQVNNQLLPESQAPAMTTPALPEEGAGTDGAGTPVEENTTQEELPTK
ncbi:MAG: preprotein translocase subunit SecG [Fimbriimonadaceae bacterium]|nr:preprotein translocase subunit SecG [Chitinophagales bacterium]